MSESLKNEIANAISAADAQAEAVAHGSQLQYMENAAPGTPKPNFGQYEAVDNASREKLNEISRDCFGKVMDALNSHHKANMSAITAPASADEIATVQLALSRDGITVSELNALIDRYGHNYQLAQAIREKGLQMHVGWDCPVNAYDFDAAEAMASRTLNRYQYDAHHQAQSASGDSGLFAQSIVDAYSHVDVFGRAY